MRAQPTLHLQVVLCALWMAPLFVLAACAPAAPSSSAGPGSPITNAAAPSAVSSPVVSPSPSASAGSVVPVPSPQAGTGSGAVVRVGGLTGAADHGIWTGIDLGFYDQQGVQLDYTTYSSFTEMLPLLASGQLDVGVGGLSPAFFNALNEASA